MWPKYDRPFFFHFRDKNVFNAVTVCMKPYSMGVGKFKVGLACCSKLDNFSRKVGRYISEGRANICEENQIVEAEDLAKLKEKAQQLSDMAEKVYVSYRNVK